MTILGSMSSTVFMSHMTLMRRCHRFINRSFRRPHEVVDFVFEAVELPSHAKPVRKIGLESARDHVVTGEELREHSLSPKRRHMPSSRAESFSSHVRILHERRISGIVVSMTHVTMSSESRRYENIRSLQSIHRL